ncbi:hypothetical protein [Nitrosomonas marina]|uniref:Iron complex outermembrane recepter protein n=1 Tax=Nitrosomonas marina TaxID=917 RepID=A0A1H8C783_9PROT|nr:hypothetical protein [Nitrosomonas marina]SEM89957.1 iron complex outermembrane recepter protein [Nitrosomonas marina]
MPSALHGQDQSTETVHYSIPPGPLEQSLNRFTQQAGITISMDADQIKHLNTGGLEGNHSTETGLATLLKNRGFTFEKNAAGYVLVDTPALKLNKQEAVNFPKLL